jgi:hypothetical protein
MNYMKYIKKIYQFIGYYIFIGRFFSRPVRME